MTTLRELRDNPNTEFQELLQAQILTGIIDSQIVPMSPDDIIADPERDEFDVRKSDSCDLSFAPPELLFSNRNPDQNDVNFVLGMAIYYMHQNVGLDLAMKANQPTIHIYQEQYRTGEMLLADEELAKNPGLIEPDTLLDCAARLTSNKAAVRAVGRQKLDAWILRQHSEVEVQFECEGKCVRVISRVFPTERRTNMTLSAGKTLEANRHVYQIMETRVAKHKPGRHTLKVPVEKVR